jgi:UDP-glucose 4-epimerase
MPSFIKALVTGGAGFIGSNLVDKLIEDGHQVLVVDNLFTGYLENLHPDAEFEEVDITSEELVSVFDHWRPEIVFHLAAQANVRLSLENPLFDTRVNAQGTLKVLEASRLNDVKKVIFSSTGGAIYGEPEVIPCDEDHPCKPLCLYGANKLVAEHYLEVYRESYGLKYGIIRFPNIYGPKQSPKGEAGVVAIFSEIMLRGEKPVIFGDGSKTRDYVHVDDAVSSLIMCVDAPDGKIYNIGTGLQTTDQEVFDAIAEATGYDEPPTYGEVRPGEVIHIALDAKKITKELGWQPTIEFRGGIRRTVPYYRRKLGITS